MSYCRFSDDDSKSDVYVWGYKRGIRILVARDRIIDRRPLSGHLSYKTKPITLPHAGEEFDCNTKEKAREQLRILQDLGYHIPTVAFLRLQEEINMEQDTKDQANRDRKEKRRRKRG